MAGERQEELEERYRNLIEQGTLLVENEQDDYADVVLGPGEDLEYVALAYVHVETVVLSTDLETDAVDTTRRWFAYDVTDSVPGIKVGRMHAGYATRDEAVLALVDAFAGELAKAGFAA